MGIAPFLLSKQALGRVLVDDNRIGQRRPFVRFVLSLMTRKGTELILSEVLMKCRDWLHELVKEEIEKKDSSTEEWKIAMERSFNRMDNEIFLFFLFFDSSSSSSLFVDSSPL
ncbi:putative protein phosphatase 2C 24 [Camellia lanceoleosa]|uniref:Uncharacterized protein n=1 Tax=Camellia lanceoleosa TaxID=1840588 RepID=A0ACC0IC72_9ERIC|nr:putative protein phosphatase 2C 24 [Camellia lanceoleosa]